MQIASFVKDELEEMFDRVDENGDRSISFEEFSSLMRDMDHTKTNNQLRANFDAIDTDHDGRVSFDEFCHWVVH
jgi:Ca2+-binding EF-hand superfamily protein